MYRLIKAKFDSVLACGHPAKRGDEIAWNNRRGRHDSDMPTMCRACYETHMRRIAADDFDQMVYDSQYGGR